MKISRALNDCLYDAKGEEIIDLISGFGSVFLGHCNPKISQSIKQQIDKVGHTGRLSTPIGVAAHDLLKGLVPDSLQQISIYTGGTEAVEFAFRVASKHTGKTAFIGFENSMHGKSFATSQLGWDNKSGLISNITRIPYLPCASEAQILDALESRLQAKDIAAVFIEPMLGATGGYYASKEFHTALRSLCIRMSSLLIFDEILTGFRAGQPFLFQKYGVVPDILVFGKAIGNGFPVSCIAINNNISITKEMLPESTFSENPISSAAIVATITEMKKINIDEKKAKISEIINSQFMDLTKMGFILRGQGALWFLEIPESINVDDLCAEIMAANVVVSNTVKHIRLLPSVTITEDHLLKACTLIKTACIHMKNK